MNDATGGPNPLRQFCPPARQLDDLELLLSGALAPVRTFNEPGSPITLDLPAGGGPVELVDPEGLPLAELSADGELTPLSVPEFGPFRRLQLTPEAARAAHAGSTWVLVDDALTDVQARQLRGIGTPVVLLVLTGTGSSRLSAPALLRAALAAAPTIGASVVAVPLARHEEADADLRATVLRNYAADDPTLDLEPGGDLLPEVEAIVEHDRPGPDRRGLVLFFTGLSGSGKSTLARALTDRILERGERTITSLDGDVVRRHLSAGLTFSKEDRETNIRRIGWVAAEIARHGGVAVCSPIAPFDETRKQVRAMVTEAGGEFFLVHVATPLEECERRDRKGLYAKARRGEIPEFTGISSPYEEPADADVRVDTTGRTIEEALSDVEEALASAGLLHFDTSRPIRVLFVCTANICRSPFMQLRAATFPGIEATSSGIRGFSDREMDHDMAQQARELGLEPAEFRSRPISGDLLAEADVVLTAEAAHRAVILEEHPEAFRKVFTLGQFLRGARALAQRGDTATGLELVAQLGTHRPPALVADDIADPYGQGPAAAADAAARLAPLVDEAMARLTGAQNATSRATPPPAEAALDPQG